MTSTPQATTTGDFETIKIRWEGRARDRIHDVNLDFDSERSDLVSATLDRQKTNIVIESADEAEAIATVLRSYEGEGGRNGRTWMNGPAAKACGRRVDEIIDSMEKQGFDADRVGITRVRFERVDEQADDEPTFKLACSNCKTISRSDDPSAECPECGRKSPQTVGFEGDVELAEAIESADLPDDVDPSRLDAATARDVLERVEQADDADQDEADEPDEPEPDQDVDERVDALESAGLSGREAQVVARKENGLTHAEIAVEIELTKATVDEYSRRAGKKLEQARALLAAAGDLYA